MALSPFRIAARPFSPSPAISADRSLEMASCRCSAGAARERGSGDSTRTACDTHSPMSGRARAGERRPDARARLAFVDHPMMLEPDIAPRPHGSPGSSR